MNITHRAHFARSPGLPRRPTPVLPRKALDKIHRERHTEPIDVAIVYGAAHVNPAITYLITAHGYRVADAEWLTVFDY